MQFELADMLRPKVHPGSKIDYEWPEENVRVRFTAEHPFSLVEGNTISDAVTKAVNDLYAVKADVSA